MRHTRALSIDQAIRRIEAERAQEFERLVSELSTDLVAVSADGIDRCIEKWLERMAQVLQLERSAVAQMVDGEQLLVRTHTYTAPGYLPIPEHIRTEQDLPWVAQQMRERRMVVLSTVDDLPAEAVQERQYMLAAGGPRSSVLIPLAVGGRAIGLMTFASMGRQREWAQDTLKRLQMVADIFANALMRKDAERRIGELIRFQQLVASLSARFIGVSRAHIDEGLGLALREILAFFGVKHCMMVEVAPETGEASMRQVTQASDAIAVSPASDFAACCPWTYATLFVQRDAVVVNCLEHLPPEAATDRATAQALGIRSSIHIPLAVGGVTRYALGLGSDQERYVWTDQCEQRLRLLGETLANALTRARGEEALRTSEERFRQLVEAAPDGVLMIDMAGHIILVNRQAEVTFGYRRDELFGKDVEMLLPLRYRTRRHDDRGAYMANPQIRLIGAGEELYGLRRDGTEVPVEIGLNPIRTSDGTFLVITVVDISERERAEQALRASAHRLAEAERIARLGSWEWDIPNDTSVYSEEAQRILGIQSERLTGFMAMVDPDDRAQLQRKMQRMFRDGRPAFDLEYRVVRLDEAERIIRVRGEIHYSSNSIPARALGTVQDVTEVRRAEYERRTLRAQLLHSDRVAHIGTLTASLAHELNQPLTGIMSNAQAGLRFLAYDHPDLVEIRELLEDIVSDDKRAAGVIRSLRAMVRRQETERELIDVPSAVGDMLTLLHGELIGANIEVSTDFEPGCSVLGDKVQLQQVMLNLIMNAIDAMRDPLIARRTLRITVFRSGKRVVQLAIRDSGVGIAPERRESVFDAFSTTKSQGMGLGLAVCRSIVDSHGGRVWLEDNEGDQGTTFFVELSYKAPADVDSRKAAPGRKSREG